MNTLSSVLSFHSYIYMNNMVLSSIQLIPALIHVKANPGISLFTNITV